MASIDFPLTLSRSLKNVIEVLYWTQSRITQAHGRVPAPEDKTPPLSLPSCLATAGERW